MKILYGYKNAEKNLAKPVLAIGIFDGIHLGHKRVIKRLLNDSSPGSDKVVVTFDPHPRTILFPKRVPPRIMSLEHRLSILEKMGVDAVIVIRFTEFIAKMSPEDFVKKILKGIGSEKVYIGSNFMFGHERGGDSKHFVQLGKKHGIIVKEVSPVKNGRKIISSTWLRDLISSGKIKKAEKLLRRPVSVLGTVVKGDQRGRELGIPTANIDPHHEIIPPPGVYAVIACFDGLLSKGVLNIGFKPTFYGRQIRRRKEPQIEVNIPGYDGDLYGKNMEIFFIKKIRSEKKFRNGDALKKRIKKDIEIATEILSNNDGVKKIVIYNPCL
ncbi:MAG: bifunctional riboflavin kinase/FAD synthetase [Candidatus Aadella gelida]|nr:bifunctional riboflavin kinase/FAD synthetase [Candidatus Aadella gelida]